MEEKESKQKDTFYSNLLHRFNTPGKKKYYYYFLWKNKLSNSSTDFKDISVESFIDKYLKKVINGKITQGTKSYKMLQMWESTSEYLTLMQEYYSIKMNQDYYKLYETYLEKAIDGDDKALSSLGKVKKEIESLNKAQGTTKPIPDKEPQYDMK
jgi:hypothetical protein